MKKIFSINVPNKKPARQVDAIKHEINKYVSRERRKKLPEGADFWDFKCKIGEVKEAAQEVHLTKVNTTIDKIVASGKEEFYLEVSAKARTRQKRK